MDIVALEWLTAAPAGDRAAAARRQPLGGKMATAAGPPPAEAFRTQPPAPRRLMP